MEKYSNQSLAKALARRGKEILVIDSDESNYGLHRQLV